MPYRPCLVNVQMRKAAAIGTGLSISGMVSVIGRRDFGASARDSLGALADGDTFTALIQQVDANNVPDSSGLWEVCDATFSNGPIVTRGAVIDSSAGGVRVNFTGATLVSAVVGRVAAVTDSVGRATLAAGTFPLLQLGNDPGAGNATAPGTWRITQSASALSNGGGLELVGSTFGAGYGFKFSAIDSAGVSLVLGGRDNSATWSGLLNISTLGRMLLIAPEALGYGTGSGGTVTQATSKATGVTLNRASGQITLNGAALAANTAVSFTFTNSLIAAADTVNVCIGGAATAGAYVVQADQVAAGSCRISLRNLSAGSLSEALVLNFCVIKGATA